MPHNVLITGGSGYLGGTLLKRLSGISLPYEKLYALVRTDEQAEGVKGYGAEPLGFSIKDENEISDAILKYKINVVFYLIDAINSTAQTHIIRALAKLKDETGHAVHFLQTTGAKLFSSHCGAPTDRELLDTDPELYRIQKSQHARVKFMQPGLNTNNTVIDFSNSLGVRSYLFAPCIVCMLARLWPYPDRANNLADGKGEGFGKKISIQTDAIITAATGTGQVYDVNEGQSTWPVCHLSDNTSLYIQILSKILSDDDIGYGENGYYLAASGSVAWSDIYSTIARALHERGAINQATVSKADNTAVENMANALKCPKEMVPVQIGGECTFTARRGQMIGWKAQFPPHHILDCLDEEVEWILEQKGHTSTKANM